jgi:hypothetical protein
MESEMTEIESQVAEGFRIRAAVMAGAIDEEEALALLEELPLEVTIALAVSE